MKFGVLRDIKNGEYRVIATPAEVRALKLAGCDVLVSSGAGVLSGFYDDDYEASGARIVQDNETVWAECDYVVHDEFQRRMRQVCLGTYRITGCKCDRLRMRDRW